MGCCGQSTADRSVTLGMWKWLVEVSELRLWFYNSRSKQLLLFGAVLKREAVAVLETQVVAILKQKNRLS